MQPICDQVLFTLSFVFEFKIETLFWFRLSRICRLGAGCTFTYSLFTITTHGNSKYQLTTYRFQQIPVPL